jgi:peptidoglycan/xylan/chitin deacetylase (PgdA/CDA1 family)
MSQSGMNTVCLTFDFDAMSVWLGGYPHVTPAMLSRGEFGARVGVPRILELLRRFDICATFFTPGRSRKR